MTETQMDVSKAGLDWKDFPEKERSQGSPVGPTAEPDGPCHWSTWKKPTQLSGPESFCCRFRVRGRGGLLGLPPGGGRPAELPTAGRGGSSSEVRVLGPGEGQTLGWQIQMFTPPEKYWLPK